MHLAVQSVAALANQNIADDLAGSQSIQVTVFENWGKTAAEKIWRPNLDIADLGHPHRKVLRSRIRLTSV